MFSLSAELWSLKRPWGTMQRERRPGQIPEEMIRKQLSWWAGADTSNRRDCSFKRSHARQPSERRHRAWLRSVSNKRRDVHVFHDELQVSQLLCPLQWLAVMDEQKTGLRQSCRRRSGLQREFGLCLEKSIALKHFTRPQFEGGGVSSKESRVQFMWIKTVTSDF